MTKRKITDFVDWNLIRAEYEAGAGSNVAIAKRHGVSEGAIRKRVTKEGWQKAVKSARPAAARIIDNAVDSEAGLSGDAPPSAPPSVPPSAEKYESGTNSQYDSYLLIQKNDKKAEVRDRKLFPDEETLARLMELASIRCTQEEAAACMLVGRATLVRFLAEFEEARDAWEMGQLQGVASVRRTQFRLMKEGSASLAIWLGKQMLGQVDSVKHDHGSLTEAIREAAASLDGKVADFVERNKPSGVSKLTH